MFRSEIGSGFEDPGGTPPPRIPRSTLPPGTKSKLTTAVEHFLSSPNHPANDMQLIPIEKIFSNRDSIREAREAFLIQKGRTIDPHGLNYRHP